MLLTREPPAPTHAPTGRCANRNSKPQSSCGTRLARHGLDFYRALGDFRHLELEELFDEFVAGAAEYDFRAARRGLDFKQQAAYALALRVILAGDGLAARQQGFRLAEVDYCGALFAAAHYAGDDVSDVTFVLVENPVLLKLAHFLDYALVDVLCGDSPEVGEVDFALDDIADARIVEIELGLVEMDFGGGVGDAVGDRQQRPRLQSTRLGVYVYLQIVPRLRAL